VNRQAGQAAEAARAIREQMHEDNMQLRGRYAFLASVGHPLPTPLTQRYEQPKDFEWVEKRSFPVFCANVPCLRHFYSATLSSPVFQPAISSDHVTSLLPLASCQAVCRVQAVYDGSPLFIRRCTCLVG